MKDTITVQVQFQDSRPVELVDEVSIGKFGQRINLNHPSISTKHCTLYLENSVVSIEDHNSETGTYIGGKRIESGQKIMLLDDDTIKVGELNVILKHLAIGPIPPPPEITQTKTELMAPEADLEGDEIFHREFEDFTATRDGNTKILTETDLSTEAVQENYSGLSHSNTVDLQTMAGISRGDESYNPHNTMTGTIQLKLKEKEVPVIEDYGIWWPIRFMAFLIDLNLAIMLVPLLVESQMSFTYSWLSDLLSGLLGAFLGSSVKAFMPVVAVFMIMRLLSALILRRSPGQFIAFIGVEKVGLSPLRCVARELLGFILGPLLIFDLPALLGKPTIKEILPLARFYTKKGILSLLLAGSGLAVSIFFTYLAVLFNANPVNKLAQFEFSDIKFSGTVATEKMIVSDYFNFTKPKQSKYFFGYPNFTSRHIDEKKVFEPGVRIYYPKDKFFFSVGKKGLLNFQKLYEGFFTANPLAFMQFETVQKQFEGKTVDPNQYEEELKNLIKASLELSQDNLLAHTSKYGPFYKGYINFKTELQQQLDGEIEAVRFVEISNTKFMLFLLHKGKFSKAEERDVELVSLGNKSLIYSFTFNDLLQLNLERATTVIRRYLTGVKWMNQPQTIDLSKIDEYVIVDYFKDVAKVAHTEEEHEVIYDFFFKIAARLMRAKSENLRNDFIEKLDQFLRMIIGLNQTERKKMDEVNHSALAETKFDQLVKKTNELLNAMKNSDAIYFSAKPQPTP